MSTNSSAEKPHQTPTNVRTHTPALRDDLKAYADGELSVLRRWQIRRHLSNCAGCRKEITGLKRVSDEMRNLPLATPRPELRARIMASLPDAPPAPSRPHPSYQASRLTGHLSLAGATFALLLVSLLALAYYRTSGSIASRVPPGQQPSVHTIDPPNTIANGTDETGHTATGVLTPQEMSGTGDQTSNQAVLSSSESDTSAPIVEMKDPTSIAADRIIEEHQAELDRAIQRERRRAQQMLAAAQARKDRPGAAPSTHNSLQLAVADVAVAQERLRGLVQNVGGSLTSPTAATTSGSASVSSAMPANAARQVNPAEVAVPAAVISISIPASQIGRFQSALREIGAPTVWKQAATGASRGSITSGNGPIPVPRRALEPRSDAPIQEHTSGIERAPIASINRTTDDHSTGYMVFTIRLQPSAHTTH